jgi:gluconate 2-dehydrogenase gamma chain
MLSNPEYGGNFNKMGWKLIGFDDRFSWAPPFGWYDANE